jgi:predicted DNA-binding transcriptional regulator YafY
MADELSPTARALLALEAIQTAPGIRGDRLAARLGVSGRAVRRYIGILREAGIPVDSVSGPYGGYRIGRGVRVPPLTFSTSEALGLVMAVLQGWHGSVHAEHPAATALAKIVRVLPAATAAPADAMRQVRAQNPGDAAAMPDPELTAEVARACEAHRAIRVHYRSRPGTEWETTVDAWAVVVRHGRWYLLCRAHHADARRVLRLDRVSAIEDIGRTYEPLDDLDPVREVEDHLAEGWAHEIEIRFEAPFDTVAPWTPRTMGRLRPIDENSCVLRGSTDYLDQYAAALAAVPARFTVIRPAQLRDELRELAHRLALAADAALEPR